MFSTNNRKPTTEIILEEISLEGLEGITLDCFWRRISDAFDCKEIICDILRDTLWNYIVNTKNLLDYYELPVSRSPYVPFDRYANLDSDYGIPIASKEYTPLYKFNPISAPNIRGSCEFFKERKVIDPQTLKSMSFKDVEQKWGNKFVMVGSQITRNRFLIDDTIPLNYEINNFQYCVLEYIGRSRYNGEITAGKRSLQNICNDSTIIFYVRNKLVSMGFCKKQIYTEKTENRLMTSSLLTLTRFFRETKTSYEMLIEKFFNILVNQPNKSMPFLECKSQFPEEQKRAVKKLVYTPYFRKIFEVKFEKIDNDKGTEPKQISIIRLRNPEMTIDDLWVSEEKIDNEGDDDVIEFIDESNFFSDMPLIPQTYRAIDKFGKEGCSQMQIIKYMALPRYTVRALMKTVLSHGIVSTYIKDVGRQRIKMYVTIKNTVDNEKTEDAEKVNDILANMKCDELPEHLKESKAQNKNNTYDSSKVLVTCKEVNWDTEKAITKSITDNSMRQVKRKNAIVNIVNENYVVSIGNLKNLILKDEAESGYKFEICKKSVVRCLHWLCHRKIVRFFEVNIKYEENSQTTRYVCHPSIDANHPVLIDQINTMKNDYLVTLDERKQKQESSHHNSSKTLTQFKTEKMNLLNFNIRLPKFLISRFFHEFLFYLTYDIQEKTTPIVINEEVTNRWKEFNPKANYILEIKNNCKCEDELLYQNEVNWKMFVPPLPKYEDKPNGWVYLPDIIERIPLSVFSKIFQIDKVLHSKTNEYLQDPILQHILVKYLPSNEITVNKRLRMQCTYMTILKILNNTGLIQIGERHFKDPLQIWIYSNRKTRLLDTTTSEPSTSCISDQDYEKIDYNFKNLQDVQEYWTTLHRISLQTQLGCITKTKSKSKSKSRSTVTLLPAVSFNEAGENDLGIPPGDKIGAGGIDSRLCSYLGIFWSWRIPTKKIARPHKTKAIRSRIFVTKIDNKKVKKRARIIIGATKKSQQKTKRQSKPKLSYACDEIDKDALKHMSSIRVKWSPEEDRCLKITRAVFSYLNPSLNLHHSFLSLHEVSKIQRDIMRSILHSYNKTSIACLRRTQFLMKRFRNTQEVPLWLHILQQNKFIQIKYGEHFFNNLKSVYPDPLKYEKALKVHFVLIIGYLMQLIEKTTSPFHNSDKNIIPDTLKEFHASFKELSKVNETVEIIYRNPLNNVDIQISTLDNLVHSSLCCTRDKTTYEIQLFEIYKNYSEEILQKAFKYAKTNGLVVINKRRYLRPSQSQLTQLTGPWYIFSNKYRLQWTYIGIPYNVLSMCSENLEIVFKTIFGDGNTIKFKAPNSGQLFFISELMMNQQFQFDLQIPSNILTFDPNAQSPTMSDPERILEHFRQIFENAPKTEYVKYFENELDKQPTIKFNIANERYKIDYNPYDIISKLPEVYIHFFCALDNLYHPAALDFPKLKEDNVCPFNCILKKDNYLTEIERIVNEKKSIINSLDSKSADDNADTELLDSIAIIKPENLMHVFETFKTLVNIKDADINRKDFGKIQLKSNDVDIIGICKDIHEYNDDDHLTKSSEFEPTLTKEERIFKAQDVFVVNLPTVEISLNTKYPKSEEFIYKDSSIPKQFAQPIEERTKILKKITRESVWIDNQKTEEYLFEQMKLEDFTALEESFTISVLKYIKDNDLGVDAKQLLERFEDEVALEKSINFLRKEYFVMRVGVESFVYVHKSHLEPWIIKTYHIKRLERETIKCIATEHHKRKPEDDENNVDQTSNSSKRVKLDDPKATNEEKRLSKPVIRYSECEGSSSTNYLPKDRVPILLRPCPWIRVNGSINRRVLDKLIGSILLECVSKCGCTIKTMCGRFNLLHPVDIMFLLEILRDIGCLTLNARSEETVSIFSEYKEPKEYSATQFTSMENAYICTSATAITNIALFIGEKKYTNDFI